MKRCKKCLVPETQETVLFDGEGVCNICRQIQYKRDKIDWEAKKKDLAELVESYRGKNIYDCIVPFSGGKDSTFTLYYLVKKFKLKPLVVQFDHGFMRPTLLENNKRTIRKLGVDFHTFTPNWKIVRMLMLQSFLEKGDFCWHCHTGIFAYPMQVALRYRVPLVFWGEPSAEYTSYYNYEQPEEVDEKRFNRFVNLGITSEDMLSRLGGDFDERDLEPFKYPQISELRKLNYRSVCLGSYIPWDTKKQYKIIHDELGWRGEEVENVPPEYCYEKIECYMQGVRDYIKYIKRGFSRPTHLASIDIRNGRLTREEGLKSVEQYEGKRPPSLDLFLEFIGLTEAEFMEVAKSHAVSPFVYDETKKKPGNKTHDFSKWLKGDGLPPEQAEIQFARWKNRQRTNPKAGRA